MNSKIEPKPCNTSTENNDLKSIACNNAKNTITISIDTTTDSLRLLEYLYNILKNNMNGTNLINYSPINENNNATMDAIFREFSAIVGVALQP